MGIHSVHTNPGKGWTTVLATPLTGKHAGRCIQMPRKDIPFAGFGHKFKEKLTPNSWTSNLHDGVIYVYSETYGFAETDARYLIDLHQLLGRAFVMADPGILIAPKKIFSPKLAQRMAGMRMGIDQHGDDVIAWIICTKKGTKRVRDKLPSYKRRVHSPVPNEAA